MRRLEGGVFAMGSERFYPEEAPARRVRLSPFWIDEVPVTNAAFLAFVDATGYRTEAEQALGGLEAGSLLFRPTAAPVPLDDPSQWWTFEPGVDWRHPEGAGSSLDDLWDHPVVHVTCGDAEAFARWCGKALPTEAEWEFASRGGLEGADYAWGDVLAPQGVMLANYWQGAFPFANQLLDGWERTSPVRTYPANGFGMSDMIGNVWEWTADWYGLAKSKACCSPQTDPRGGRKHDSQALGETVARRVVKGGSFLCAEDYCRRYRPAARSAQAVDTSASHIGFRCVVRSFVGPSK